MRFQDVIGQNELKQHLLSSVQDERMAHAQIFLGPEGSGKLALAIAYAQYVLCENKGETDSCGTCPACSKVTKHIHPDLHYAYPTIGTNAVSNQFLEDWRKALSENPYHNVNQWLQRIGAENKQGNITKAECNDIIRKLSLKTFESKHKILIIWLPEYLKKEGNRLLKMIEEPPENTLFILVAEKAELILNTILSRCQLLKVNKLSDEELLAGLSTLDIEGQDAMELVHLSDGNFNEAQKLIGKLENDNANWFVEWFRICYKGSPTELVKWVDRFSKIGRENQKHFIHYALFFMRELMVIQLMGNNKARLQAKELQVAEKMSLAVNFDQIEQIKKLLDETFYYVERNANPKVLFLDLSVRIHRVLRKKAMHAYS